MKSLVLFLVAASVASQVLGQNADVSGDAQGSPKRVKVTTVKRGGAKLGLLSGTLGGYKRKCGPEPLVATVGWAQTDINLPPGNSIGTGGSQGNTSIGLSGNICYDVCGYGYDLAAISSPIPVEPPFPSGPPAFPAKTTPFLCRFTYKTTTTKPSKTETLYGYYTQELGVCQAFSPTDNITVQADPAVPFFCGCCGLINKQGVRWERGCPAVTAVTPNKNTACPNDRPWTSPSPPPTGALPGTDICLRSQGAGKPALWGTISPKGDFNKGLCFVADPDPAATGQLPPPATANSPFFRFCYKINGYNGPIKCPDKKNP